MCAYVHVCRLRMGKGGLKRGLSEGAFSPHANVWYVYMCESAIFIADQPFLAACWTFHVPLLPFQVKQLSLLERGGKLQLSLMQLAGADTIGDLNLRGVFVLVAALIGQGRFGISLQIQMHRERHL